MQIFFLTAFVTFSIFCVNEGKYPNILKQTNITAAFKERLHTLQGELSFFRYFTCHC